MKWKERGFQTKASIHLPKYELYFRSQQRGAFRILCHQRSVLPHFRQDKEAYRILFLKNKKIDDGEVINFQRYQGIA